MSGKPKFLFGGEGGTYEEFERKLLSEISKAGLSTEFKKKSFLYKHLTGTVLDTLTKLLFPIKISDKSFDELLVSLKTHYIPNKHLRERVLLYARLQEEGEKTKDYFETLKSIASRCKYKDDELRLVLCDKVLTGIRCPRLRESLFAAGISPAHTAEKYMEYALLYEMKIDDERLAREKKLIEKNKKLGNNRNIDRSPSPNSKKPKSDSPASMFGVALKKGIENNNISRNGSKGSIVWKPKVPLTPQSTFGVTLKSKSTSQVSPGSPKSPSGPFTDVHKENQSPILNGTQNNSNGMSSPKPMTIPEIMEFVKEPRKPGFSQEANKILLNKSSVNKSAQQREPSWSRSPSPEPRKPADKNNQNIKTTKPPLRRESSWSPSPSPEPVDIKIQNTRGRSFVKDSAPKMKRSNSTLSVRDKPSVNDLSPTNTKTPAPRLKRSSSSVSLTRNPLPDIQESFDPMRSLRQGLAALKSVKHLKPEPEKKEKFDMSDKLPKLRSVGGFRRSPTEIAEFMPDLLEEITDFEPRKPTITPEARRILDKYLNKPSPKMESPKITPKMDTPKILPRREPSYSPSPEPEPRPESTRKPLFNKCAKPSTTLPNKSMSYSDLTKSDLFDQFLQAKNTQTQKSQKPFKVNRPVKKDEVPQLTDDVRRKLEEKYGLIKGKPKDTIIEEPLELEIDESSSRTQQIIEPLQPEIDKSPSRAQPSRDIFAELFEDRKPSPIISVVKPSDRVVQMYKESQQAKEALKEDAFTTYPAEKTNGYQPISSNPYIQKPLSTIKASPKIAEMYKAQIMDRDKTKCPSPPPEKDTSNITRFVDKKWVSTLDLSISKKEYNVDPLRTPQDDSSQLKRIPKPLIWSPSVSPEPHDNRDQSKKETTSLRREPSWSPSVSPEPKDNSGRLKKEITKPSRRREPSWSPSVSPEPKDNCGQLKKETPKSSLRREQSWSPSVSPEPQDKKSQLKKEIGQLKKDIEKSSLRREPSWSPSPSPEPRNIRSPFKNVSPEPTIRREPSWSPSPSPEPRDTKCHDNRGRSSAREPSSQLKRSCSNLNARDKPSTNTTATAPTLKRSCSTFSVSRTPRILNEIEEIPEKIEPRKSVITAETKKIVDKYCNRREPSYSPSPEPEPRSDLTREQLFDKYANLSTTHQARSSSYLDLTKSDIFDQFLQARDSPQSTFSKVKKQIKVNKSAKKEEVKELTDDDRRALEEKYGIIRGKPKELKPEGEESPETKRKKSPSRAQLSRQLFEEKEKALKTGAVKDADKDEQTTNPLPSNSDISNGVTPTTPNEKPTLYSNIIKSSTTASIAEKYKAELEKNQKSCQSPLTEKAATIIARSSEKRGSLDLTPLDLARMKKESDAQSLKKDALKYNVKECKYSAEVDYGDSLLKVSEKDAFTVRTMKTEFSSQDRTDSPGPSVIPPKPGSAAAAKPQFDIASFFDGSSYSNFLQSAKSTKGGTNKEN